MLTMSKPLSAAQLRTYHAEEFANGRANYYATADRITGQWHGRLAQAWGLSGPVAEEQMHRLADGHHPLTGAPLVRHQTARTYTTEQGTVRTMTHRAGWDLTFSAPKSVSLTALVGGDERVLAAHQASVQTALDAMEPYVQARIGRSHPPETTGKWVAARFEHDSARPVDGYAAPQVHTHVVVFNVTERANAEPRALQPRELYRTQQFATAVYRGELAVRLSALGYAIERGASGQPEISGYTPEYLSASSPRRQQIEDALAREHRQGAGAAQIAAHRTRQPKLDASHADMQRRHREMARAFGDQPARVREVARQRLTRGARQEPTVTPEAAMSFARDRSFEREAVVDARALLQDALRRAMGEVALRPIQQELATRVASGEFLTVPQPPGAAGSAFTTKEMVHLERQVIDTMLAGRATERELVTAATRRAVDEEHPHLSDAQRSAVQSLLANRDRVQALDGVAGAGKTTALVAIRDAAQRDGYRVEGLAPTSRAAQKLAESGIPSGTLQRHLVQGRREPGGSPHLYVLDESSLASTRQMSRFLERLHAHDRVVLVGDVRQHQAVDAGRPYQQLQEAGLATARLEAIVRQQDPALREVVEHLSRGEVAQAVRQLERQGRVHQLPDPSARFEAIARAYLASPHGTLVVSPDNESRVEINQVIHRALQAAGHVAQPEHVIRALVARQDVTGADRQWAAQYEPGNVVRFTSGSATLGLHAGEYARVALVSAHENRLVVSRQDGSRVSYDPRHLYGVTLYRETERAFAVGDRVQFTAPLRARQVANRELGSIERIAPAGTLTVRLDSGRSVTVDPAGYPHLDHGYAVTSHSSQGQTADRVLVHVDTQQSERLVNRRFAYVAISRARVDVQVYASDQTRLVHALSRDVSHTAAIASGHTQGPTPTGVAPTSIAPSGQRTHRGHSQGIEQ